MLTPEQKNKTIILLDPTCLKQVVTYFVIKKSYYTEDNFIQEINGSTVYYCWSGTSSYWGCIPQGPDPGERREYAGPRRGSPPSRGPAGRV